MVTPVDPQPGGHAFDSGVASPYDGQAVLHIRWPILALSLLLVAAACGGDSPSPSPNATSTSAPADNVFPNPGFEAGRDPWFSLKPPHFILSEDIAHSGEASAYLPLEADESEEGVKIIYLVQEVSPEELPEVISGYYRVENWNRGTEKQYVQFVVIVWGADNAPSGFQNYQIRYLLSGIKAPPFAIGNAKFVFLSRDDPQIGEWVRFERNLREDFEKFWGAVPQNFDYIRVLFEVRYDDKAVGEGPLGADVYYDDLYLGPALNP